jgi:hypothetical protein
MDEALADEPRASVRRTWPRITWAAAAAVALIVATIVLVRTANDNDGTVLTPVGTGQDRSVASSPPETAPPFAPNTTVPGDGSSTGPVLPEGAPSTPAVGELVASIAGSYALYADGRLLSVPEGASARSFPYVEQRLAPEGVERVRSALLASGEFNGAALKPPDDQGCTCVRADDGQLLAARMSQEWEQNERLVPSLRTLLASLPESAWVEQQDKPYVASRVIVCLGAYIGRGKPDVPPMVVGVPRDPSEIVPLLPGHAPELFGGLVPVPDPSSVYEPNRENVTCYEMTMDEARSLADQLLDPSVGGTLSYWAILLRDPRLGALTVDPTDVVLAAVAFHGLMPNGAASA